MTCKQTRNGAKSVVDKSECDTNSMPAVIETCNTAECAVYEWSTGTYGGCNAAETDPNSGAACGMGTQTRSVSCENTVSGSQVAESQCSGAGNKPGLSRSCASATDCTEQRNWIYGAWGDVCSETCGAGKVYREVYCAVSDATRQFSTSEINTFKATSKILGDGLCSGNGNKPAGMQPCSAGACTYVFVPGEWGPCSTACGDGTRERDVPCVETTAGITQGSGGKCGTAPAFTETCRLKVCVTYSWTQSSWSRCSASCKAEGGQTPLQTRSVSCVTDSGEVASTASCGFDRPDNSRECFPSVPKCPTFAWVATPYYSPCTNTCDGGTKDIVDNLICEKTFYDLTPSKLVSNADCENSATNTKPDSTVACNAQACPTEWVCASGTCSETSDWSSCSKPCGIGGKRVRTVACKRTRNGIKEVVTDPAAMCAANAKPATLEGCNEKTCSEYEWDATSSYGACQTKKGDPNTGVSCGPGTQSRSVICTDTTATDAANYKVSDALCDGAGDRPALSRPCRAENDCPSSEGGEKRNWVYGAWDTCSETCGGGVAYRQVYCAVTTSSRKVSVGEIDAFKVDSEILEEGLCTSSKPRTSQSCDLGACPIYEFVSSEWGQCSKACGEGKRSRTISCVEINAGDVQSDATNCNEAGLTAPESDQKCQLRVCNACIGDVCLGVWKSGFWTSCTKLCGVGVRTRTVSCVSKSDTSQNVAAEECGGARPSEEADCNAFACPQFVAGAYGACSEGCDDGIYERSVTCTNVLGAEVSRYSAHSSHAMPARCVLVGETRSPHRSSDLRLLYISAHLSPGERGGVRRRQAPRRDSLQRAPLRSLAPRPLGGVLRHVRRRQPGPRPHVPPPARHQVSRRQGRSGQRGGPLPRDAAREAAELQRGHVFWVLLAHAALDRVLREVRLRQRRHPEPPR